MNPEARTAYNEYQEKLQAAQKSLWADMAPVLNEIGQKLTPHNAKLEVAHKARMEAIAAADKAFEEAEARYAMEAADLLAAQKEAEFKLMSGLQEKGDLLWKEYREKVHVSLHGEAPKKGKKTK